VNIFLWRKTESRPLHAPLWRSSRTTLKVFAYHCSKPSIDLFPRKCTYAKVIDLHSMVLWSIGFIANRHCIPPTKSACVRYCWFAKFFSIDGNVSNSNWKFNSLKVTKWSWWLDKEFNIYHSKTKSTWLDKIPNNLTRTRKLVNWPHHWTDNTHICIECVWTCIATVSENPHSYSEWDSQVGVILWNLKNL